MHKSIVISFIDLCFISVRNWLKCVQNFMCGNMYFCLVGHKIWSDEYVLVIDVLQ